MRTLERIRQDLKRRQQFHRDAGDEENWITINGTHVLVDKEGNLSGSVGKKIAATSKKKSAGKRLKEEIDKRETSGTAKSGGFKLKNKGKTGIKHPNGSDASPEDIVDAVEYMKGTGDKAKLRKDLEAGKFSKEEIEKCIDYHATKGLPAKEKKAQFEKLQSERKSGSQKQSVSKAPSKEQMQAASDKIRELREKINDGSVSDLGGAGEISDELDKLPDGTWIALRGKNVEQRYTKENGKWKTGGRKEYGGAKEIDEAEFLEKVLGAESHTITSGSKSKGEGTKQKTSTAKKQSTPKVSDTEDMFYNPHAACDNPKSPYYLTEKERKGVENYSLSKAAKRVSDGEIFTASKHYGIPKKYLKHIVKTTPEIRDSADLWRHIEK